MLDLLQYCEEHKITEVDQTLQKRKHALNFLNTALSHFHHLVKEELSSSGILPSYITSNSIIKLYTFGSFRLGANTPSSDIDSLAVGSNFIDRQTFFRGFPDLLRKEKDYFEILEIFEEIEIPEITEVVAITDTYVPLIMFKLDGIDFDLLYCQTSLNTITNTFDVLLDFDAIVDDLDELSLRSINGARTTERILDIISKLVDEDKSEEIVVNYRVVLKSVKHWAKQRGIYSNVMGYIGGVSYSILVAKSFQLYYQAYYQTYYQTQSKGNVNNVNLSSAKKVKLEGSMANELLVHFFKMFSEWDWKTPVELIPSDKIIDSPLSWNPQKNYRDKQDRFPIITPTSPTINSSHNVYESTMNQFLYEFKRACLLTRWEGDVWSMVFSKTSLFVRYKVFIIVSFKQKASEPDFDKYAGLMKIKTRLLFNGIERVVGLQIIPYSNEFTETTTVKNNDVEEEYKTQHLLAALKIDKTKGGDRKRVSISSTIKLFNEMIDPELLEKVEVKVCHGKEVDIITGEQNRQEEIIKYKNELQVIKKLKVSLKKEITTVDINKDGIEEGEIVNDKEIQDYNDTNNTNYINNTKSNVKEETSLEEGQIPDAIVDTDNTNKNNENNRKDGDSESHKENSKPKNNKVRTEIMNIQFKSKVVDLNNQDCQDFTKI